MNQLVGPGEQQVGLVAEVALQRLAGDRLVPLEALPVVGRLRRAQHAHREDAAVTVKVGDLLRCQMHAALHSLMCLGQDCTISVICQRCFYPQRSEVPGDDPLREASAKSMWRSQAATASFSSPVATARSSSAWIRATSRRLSSSRWCMK